MNPSQWSSQYDVCSSGPHRVTRAASESRERACKGGLDRLLHFSHAEILRAASGLCPPNSDTFQAVAGAQNQITLPLPTIANGSVRDTLERLISRLLNARCVRRHDCDRLSPIDPITCANGRSRTPQWMPASSMRDIGQARRNISNTLAEIPPI